MRARTVLLLALSVCVLTIGVRANEKPTPEYQNIMKSNGATNGAIGMHLMAKDYAAIEGDVATLKANFAKTEAFWAAKKADDAVTFSKNGVKALADLEAAAKAKDDAAIGAARMALGMACGGCHMAHRERLPDMSFEIK